jgi:hypothetical protein
MALARVLSAPELSQVEVECPRAPDGPKSDLNGTDQLRDLCFILACMQMIAAPLFALAAREVCPKRGG